MISCLRCLIAKNTHGLSMIVAMALCFVIASCEGHTQFPVMTIDHPMARVDSTGCWYVSDSGKVWYPVYFKQGQGRIEWDGRYKPTLFEITFEYIGSLSDSWDNPDFYKKYQAEFRPILLYSRVKCIGKRKICYQNTLPSRLCLNVPKSYCDEEIYLLKTAHPDEYIIIPDWYWNAADELKYDPIALRDRKADIQETGYRHWGDSVFVLKSDIMLCDVHYTVSSEDPLRYVAMIVHR